MQASIKRRTKSAEISAKLKAKGEKQRPAIGQIRSTNPPAGGRNPKQITNNKS
jgi:hypothetical protein